MTLIHEETLARYQELLPPQFVESVILGTLRDHIHNVYTVVNVYARIMMAIPGTEDLRLNYVPNTILQYPVELRDVMYNMQVCAMEAYNMLQLDFPLHSFHVEEEILRTITDIQRPVEAIDRWAAAIEGDAMMKNWLLPELRGKTPSRIASEIRQYMFDTNQVLLFAQAYALRWCRKSRH